MKKTSIILFVVLGNLFATYAQSDEDIRKAQAIKLFPNPTSEIVFVQNGKEITHYRLFDTHGQEVQQGYHHVQIISLIDLPPGVYWFEFTIGEHVERRRVQKN